MIMVWGPKAHNMWADSICRSACRVLLNCIMKNGVLYVPVVSLSIRPRLTDSLVSTAVVSTEVTGKGHSALEK